MVLAIWEYGEKYTNEYIVEKMKARPTHNYIGQIGDPISYPCDPASVSFA